MATTAATASWGVSTTCDGTTGIITSLSLSVEGIFLDEHNEQNQVCGRFMYDGRGIVNISLHVPNGAKEPDVGKNIRIGSATYIVTRSELIEGNMQFRKYSITAEKCPKVEEAGGKIGKDWSNDMLGLGDTKSWNT